MIYQPSPIKRTRATKAEMAARRDALFEIVEAQQPATVRQVFYAATVRGVIEKTEAGYRKVQTDLVAMRRDGTIPFGWLADSTRWMRKPTSYRDPADAITAIARLYRRDLWADAGVRVEVWLEKDALAGVIYDVTADFDVPLMVTRGYASLSFLHSAAEAITEADVPTAIYHLGDFDPSGVDAARKVAETLRELAPEAEIHFERLGVTEEQISRLRLPTRPTKSTDTRAAKFGDVSVELDAIPPSELRDMVHLAIAQHVPAGRYEYLQTIEAEERQMLYGLAGMAAHG